MIIINVPSGSVKSLIASYLQAIAFWFASGAVCMRCQGPYQSHGSYLRKTPATFGPTRIKRVYCPRCQVSHALLPCFIIPHARVMDVVREAAVKAISFETHTLEELAGYLDVEPRTIARWWSQFRAKHEWIMQALAAQLAHSAQLADWACGSLDTWSLRMNKLLELIGRCRATFSPGFAFGPFAWLNLFHPGLL